MILFNLLRNAGDEICENIKHIKTYKYFAHNNKMIITTYILNVEKQHLFSQTNELNCKFIESIDLNDLNDCEFSIIPEWSDVKIKRKISVSEINIALTHHAAWKKIVENKIECALILENDIILTEHFNKNYNYVNNIVFDYDLLYFGRKPEKSAVACEVQINNKIVKPSYSRGSYAYTLTYEGAIKLLNTNFLNNLLPIDEFLSMMHDVKYPHKSYSVFFNDFEKIHALALKQNVVEKIKKDKKTKFFNIFSNNKIIIYDEKKHKKIQQDFVNNWLLHNNLPEDYLNNCLCSIENKGTFLLSQSNKTNNDILEKYVFEIMKFHIKRLNKYSEEKVYVTFECKTCDTFQPNFDIDRDAPFLKTITYLDCDADAPIIITNINDEQHKFKDFDDEILLCFSQPIKNKHISFEGGKYYYKLSKSNNNNRILIVNFYNKKIENIQQYISSTKFAEVILNFEILKHEIQSEPKLLNQHFLETILYEYDKFNENVFDEFKAKMDKTTSTYIFETNRNINFNVFNIQKFNSSNNIFLQNFHHKKQLTSEICKWLISESENYAKINLWKNIYKTIIPTSILSFFDMPSIYNFLKITFETNIIPLIKKMFEMNDNVKLNILDLFVVKYEDGKPDSKELLKGRCNITVSILLSDLTDKSKINDENITCLEQGDLLISETSHSKSADSDDESDDSDDSNPIVFTKRYILYFFINLTSNN